MTAKSSFAFYAIINCSNCVKELHLGWTLLSLSKKHPRPNLKTFQCQNLDLSEKNEKVVLALAVFSKLVALSLG